MPSPPMHEGSSTPRPADRVPASGRRARSQPAAPIKRPVETRKRGATHLSLQTPLLVGLLTALTSAHWVLDANPSKSPDDARVAADVATMAERRPSEPTPSDSQRMVVTAPASCSGIQLSPRDVQLLLEFGNSAERAFLREQLRCASDPALLEAAIGWHLDRDEYDVAAHWAEVADARGMAVLPWQRTMLALRRDDRVAVAAVLRESGEELPASARIEALRYLGEREQALRLARHEATQAADPSERERMAALADSLDRADAPRVRAGVSTLDYGPLSIRTLETGAEVSAADARLGFDVRISEFDTSAQDELDLGALDREQDLSLSLKRPLGRGELSAVAGASLREDDSIAYGSLQFQRPFTGDLLRSLSFKVALNDLSYETAWCRAFCTKSHMTAGISGGLSRWDFFNLSLDAAHYRTREDEELATGFGLDGALGYVIFQEQPRWDVSLRGGLQNNDLANRTPDSLREASADPLEIQDVLPAEYRFLGVGTSVQGGQADPSPGQLHYSLDAHAGWQWPIDEPSYGVQMSLATAWPSPRDALSFRLVYASSLAGGGSDDSFSQISLRYDRRF
jgi:hypothetical protein